MISPLTIAELRARASALELKAEQLKLTVPGRNSSLQYAQRKRATQQAADYNRLLELAEMEGK